MLKMFKKKGEQIFAPAAGTVMALADVPDPVFASGAVGEGFAVDPSEGNFVSPVDGELILLAKTLHAFAVRTDAGAEILVHIGMDTVKLKGEGFTAHRAKGESVKQGDLIISCDLAADGASGSLHGHAGFGDQRQGLCDCRNRNWCQRRNPGHHRSEEITWCPSRVLPAP